MSNFSTNQNDNLPDLLSAILAKLTIGNPAQSEVLNQLLGTLSDEKREYITQQILKHDSNIDLKALEISPSNADTESRFNIYKAAEALKPQSPIIWILDQIFSVGTVCLFVGNPGSKKTYSLLDLSICIAIGKPWLGYKTKQGAVLIIDEESGKRRLDKRLGDIMRAHSANENTELFYVTLARFDLRSIDDATTVESLIKETKAHFVVIDAFVDVMPGGDENAVKEIQPVMMNLRSIADKTQSAIVVIHHTNKQGNYRGSSALLGAVDTLIKVDSKPGSDHIEFKMEKNRDGEPLEFRAIAKFEQEKFLLVLTENQPKSRFSPSQIHVLKYYNDHGNCSLRDIQGTHGDFSEAALKKANHDLIRLGCVERTDGGGPGKKAIYALTDKGKEVVNLDE